MPRIPTGQRQVKEGVLQPGQVNTSLDIGDVTKGAKAYGQVADKAATQITNIIDQEKKEFNKAETQKAESDFRNEYTKHNNEFQATYKGKAPFDKSDPNNKDSISNVDKSIRDFDKTLQDRIDKTNDPRLKQHLSLIARDYSGKLKNKHTEYGTGQMENYKDEAFQSSIDSSIQFAINNFQDGEIGKSRSTIEDEIYGPRENPDDPNSPRKGGYAKRKGLSKEGADQLVLKSKTRMHEGMVERALNNGFDLKAKEYLEQAKKLGEISPEAASKLEKTVEASNVKGESQRETRQVMAAGMSEKDALISVRKDKKFQKDPKLMDATVTRIKNRYAEKAKIEKEKHQATYSQIVGTALQTGSIDSVPVEYMENLSAQEKITLNNVISKKAKGETIVTDRKVKYELDQMDPDEFKNLNLMEYADKLSDSHLNSLSKMQQDLKKGDKKAETEYTRLRSNNQIIKDVIKSGKVSEGKTPEFFSDIQRQVEDFEGENKRKATPDEIETMAKKLSTTKILKERVFFLPNKTKKVFEIELDDIPLKHTETIKRVIRRKKDKIGDNSPVSAHEIQMLYSSGLEND